MREAMVQGKIVEAGPYSPQVARCPACRSEVHKRGRRTMDKKIVWYYRHKNGAGRHCPRRYRFGT